jgi:hypothetical protein
LRTLLVLQAAEDRPPHRKTDVSHDQPRENIRSLDAVGEVVGVEGDDAAHSVAEVH